MAVRPGGTHVSHELLAHWADLCVERGTEHHDLLVVRRLLENGLRVAAARRRNKDEERRSERASE